MWLLHEYLQDCDQIRVVTVHYIPLPPKREKIYTHQSIHLPSLFPPHFFTLTREGTRQQTWTRRSTTPSPTVSLPLRRSLRQWPLPLPLPSR